jgi:hypothetical protein
MHSARIYEFRVDLTRNSDINRLVFEARVSVFPVTYELHFDIRIIQKECPECSGGGKVSGRGCQEACCLQS